MVVIRAKYAHLLPVETPPLWFGAHFADRPRKGTPESRARFARAYEMLLESVHLGMTAKNIGARRGISGERARQLMVFAAYTWARSERLDISRKSVPFKNEAKFVKQLYAGPRFFAQQKFNELENAQGQNSASRKREHTLRSRCGPRSQSNGLKSLRLINSTRTTRLQGWTGLSVR